MFRVYGCKTLLMLGKLEVAEAYIKETYEMEMLKRNELTRGFALLHHSLVLSMKNDEARLEQILHEMIDLGEKYGILFISGNGYRLAAQRSYNNGDVRNALIKLDASSRSFECLDNKPQYSLNILLRCLWLTGIDEVCSRGTEVVSDVDKQQKLLIEAEKEFTVLLSAKPGAAIIEIGRSILGALQREAGEYERAEQSMLASLKSSTAKNFKQVECGTLFHLAKLYFKREDRQQAEIMLGKAMAIAAENKYTTFWDNHIPTITEISLAAVHLNRHKEHAMKVLEVYYNRETIEAFIKSEFFRREGCAGKAYNEFVSFRKELAETSKLHLKIYMLGRFGMTTGGKTIPVESWKTRKTSGILKYLLLNKERLVSRKSLMQLFWPGIETKSAAVCLRTTLYELKKALAEHGINTEGENALIIDKKGSLGVNTEVIDYIDIDELKLLHGRWKILTAEKQDIFDRISIVERIAVIYRGNLLEEDIYEDWAIYDREKITALWLETMQALALYYEDIKEYSKKEQVLLEILSFDRFNEDVCTELISLYLQTNQRSRAIMLREDFLHRLLTDYGVSPGDKFVGILKE